MIGRITGPRSDPELELVHLDPILGRAITRAFLFFLKIVAATGSRQAGRVINLPFYILAFLLFSLDWS